MSLNGIRNVVTALHFINIPQLLSLNKTNTSSQQISIPNMVKLKMQIVGQSKSIFYCQFFFFSK